MKLLITEEVGPGESWRASSCTLEVGDMSDFDGFCQIEAIFYTVFHPTEGTKVSHQVPLGSIVPSPKAPYALEEPLFDFDLVKNYIIPKPQLCDRLVSLKVGQYRVIGYPVSINAPHYARNSFNFNFCFVFNYESDTVPYESCIRRLGKMFKNLEEQYQLLSKKERSMAYFKNVTSQSTDNIESNNEESLVARSHSMESTFGSTSVTSIPQISYNKILTELDNNTNSSTPIGITSKDNNIIRLGSIQDLIQQIYQDLNNYSECLIPIDSGNSVDIKLLPIRPPPGKIDPEDVPISTVNLQSIVDVNWDPTMLRILPHINGINSVKRISLLTNADYSVVKQCIQHLMYYNCIIIADIFQFSNIYAPTSDIDLFLKDDRMAAECQAYVVAPPLFKGVPYEEHLNGRGEVKFKEAPKPRDHNSFVSLLGSSTRLKKESVVFPSKAKLFFLYRSLHQGQTIKSWYKEHVDDLKFVDVRRFITFGVLRGLIYRVHSYPIIDSVLVKENRLTDMFNQSLQPFESESHQSRDKRRNQINTLNETQRQQASQIIKLLQQIRSFDAICTELNLDRKTVDFILRKIGNYNTVNS